MDILSYAIGLSRGGGGGDVKTQALNVTENGIYRAPSSVAYNPVNVDVPSVEVEELDITENGTYTPLTGKAYGPVNVNVALPNIATDTDVKAALDEIFNH